MTDITKLIILTASICSALSVLFNHVMTFGKVGNSWFNKYINKQLKPSFDDIQDSLKDIKEQIQEIRDTEDIREMQKLRYECLKFSSDIHKGIKKTREEYEEIFRMEQSYNELIEKHNIKNGFMMEEMRYVHETYRKL